MVHGYKIILVPLQFGWGQTHNTRHPILPILLSAKLQFRKYPHVKICVKDHIGLKSNHAETSCEVIVLAYALNCLLSGTYMEDFNRLKAQMSEGHI